MLVLHVKGHSICPPRGVYHIQESLSFRNRCQRSPAVPLINRSLPAPSCSHDWLTPPDMLWVRGVGCLQHPEAAFSLHLSSLGFWQIATLLTSSPSNLKLSLVWEGRRGREAGRRPRSGADSQCSGARQFWLCVISVNAFMETQFTYHTIHTFTEHSSVFSSIFTELSPCYFKDNKISKCTWEYSKNSQVHTFKFYANILRK